MSAFRIPTRISMGTGSRECIPDLLAESACQRPLIVLDPGIRETPWLGELLDGVGQRDAVAFDRLAANPRLDNAVDAARTALEHHCDAVLAVGGGSALDCAKAAAMLATNDPLRVRDYVGKNRFTAPPLPMMAIPTTCGTGSEVTWVSVLSDPDHQTKVSLKGDGMFPNWAVVDPDLLKTLPPNLVAATSMDALTHALEAFTCSCTHPVSDALAAEAIALIFEFLPRAFADIEGDGEARDAVMRASTLAGLAFGNTDVAGVHCLSESLGGMFDVPHGLANAILLVPVLESHGAAVHVRLAQLQHRHDQQARSVEAGSAAFFERLRQLAANVRIPPFATLEIPCARFDDIAAAAVANGSNDSNPRAMMATDYRAILDQLAADGS